MLVMKFSELVLQQDNVFFCDGNNFPESIDFSTKEILEPVCCKKQQKIVLDQLLIWEIRAL